MTNANIYLIYSGIEFVILCLHVAECVRIIIRPPDRGAVSEQIRKGVLNVTARKDDRIFRKIYVVS